MKELSVVAQKVQPSPIRQMFNLAAGMDDVISFTVGEPDFYTPQHIVDAAVDALEHGAHKYTPNAGILPLRQAIADKIFHSQHLHYDPERNVIVTAGGMEALMLTMMCLLDPGDEFILGNPCWTNYSRQIQICSAQPRFVNTSAEDGFVFAPEELEHAITPRTKGFLINSPANPTGSIANRAQLEQLAQIAVRHDLYVISDEVYNELVYDGEQPFSIAAVPGMAERTIIINSFSKTYAMTGWRVGYAAGPEPVIRNMVKLQENVAACVNSAAQFGALAALTQPQTAVQDMLAAYTERRALILSLFGQIPGLRCFAPQGTFYAFVDISATGMDASTFAMDLLQKSRVIVVPGDAFGSFGTKYVRLSFATSVENIREGLARIKDYMLSQGFSVPA